MRRLILTLMLVAGTAAPACAQQDMADVVYAQTPQASPLLTTIAPERNRNQVSAVQHELKSRGYKVKVDGSYGPKTRAAVKKFQRKNGLVADGVLGSETLRALGVSSLN